MHTVYHTGMHTLYKTWKLLQTAIKGFPMPWLKGRVTMSIALTATKTDTLLPAIFMPIVHKNSFKTRAALKNVINAFIFSQLFFLLEYIFYLTNSDKTVFNLYFPILKYIFSTFSRYTCLMNPAWR
jgi:hypothetical protein